VLFFSVENSSILEQKYDEGLTSVEIKENGKTYIIDFKRGIQSSKSGVEADRRILYAQRLEKWYWQDDGDVWRPFNDYSQSKIWHAHIYRLPTLSLTIGKYQYSIYLQKKKQKNLKTEFSRKLITESELEKLSVWKPDLPSPTGMKVELIKLDKGSEEFKRVSDFFSITMPKKVNDKPTNTIKEITKVYNPTLLEYWNKELEMVKKLNQDRPVVEYTRLLWHGTSHTDPKIIYNSTKGWKVNYAGEGNLWGKGLYFSQDAAYSAGKYAFMTSSGTQLLLLAEVIVGWSLYLQESKETKKYKDAPVNPDTNNPYDCVIGNRHGTWIFVTYESSRAYPTYVVEYHPNE